MRFLKLGLMVFVAWISAVPLSAQSAARTSIRDLLTSDRTYYVRTDGSNSNSGLINDSAGAFLTIQYAVDVVCNDIDNGGYNVLIQVADGAYDASVVLWNYVGRGIVTLRGNTTTPANVTITTGSARCIQAYQSSPWTVEGFSLSTTGSAANCLHSNGSLVTLGKMEFRACTQYHMQATGQGQIYIGNEVAIKGGASAHIVADSMGLISGGTATVTLTSTPAFSTAFVFATRNSCVSWKPTFSGSATGPRYLVSLNSVIDTNASGSTYFPGNSAGSSSTGGQYY